MTGKHAVSDARCSGVLPDYFRGLLSVDQVYMYLLYIQERYSILVVIQARKAVVSMHSNNESEIARFRQEQAEQEAAAHLGLHGLASGFSRHAFIEARMERAAGHILQLLADGKHEEAEALMLTRTLGDPGLEGLEEEKHGACHTSTLS